MSYPPTSGSGGPSYLSLHTAPSGDAGAITDYPSLDRTFDNDVRASTWSLTEIAGERPDGDGTVTMRGLPLNTHLTRDQFPVPGSRFPKFISDSNNRDYVLTNEIEPECRDTGVKIFVAQRVSDNKRFMAHTILKPTRNPNDSRPPVHKEGWTENDIARATETFDKAQKILPYASLSLMHLFNHPNLIKLVDIVQCSHFRGNNTQADYLVWEDCDGGSLARLLSPGENEAYVPEIRMPSNWMPMRTQAKIFEGFPEDFCWHVLNSIAKALMWLHFGVKERSGEPGQFDVHDDDWHPILHRNIEPNAIHFTQPRVRQTKYGKKLEPYGMCKLGGFGNAKVVGSVGSDFAMCERYTPGPYTAKEIARNEEPYQRSSEIFSLGAIVYQLMVGYPPARSLDYADMISWMRVDRYSKELIDVVAATMHDEPDMRPTAKSLYEACEAAQGPKRDKEIEDDRRKFLAREEIKHRPW